MHNLAYGCNHDIALNPVGTSVKHSQYHVAKRLPLRFVLFLCMQVMLRHW